jgi:amino acid adenylation domain-containing protein
MKENKPKSMPFSTRTNLNAGGPVAAKGKSSEDIQEEFQTLTIDAPKQIYPLKEFESHTLKFPDAIAVVFEDEHVTYHELNRRANQIGHFLKEKGIGPENIVGVCLNRSVDLVIGILGVLKAGGAVLPLEPSYPPKRISFMLEDGQPSAVLTHKHLHELVSHEKIPSIYLDIIRDDIAKKDSRNPSHTLREGNLFAVFYTSGSTGNPKGVLEVHQNLIQQEVVDRHPKYPNSGDIAFEVDDRFLVKCPISFAPSFWEIFTPLASGVVLILARPESEHDFPYLVQLVAEQQITVLHFVPSALRMFIDQSEITSCTSLKHVICSGETLTEDLRQHFFRSLDTFLHLYYAATEAPAATILHLHRGNLKHPLAFETGHTTKIHVLTLKYKKSSVGLQGEIHIEAKGKIRGYLGNPALTAEKFVPDPMSHAQGSRLYKTGDLASYTKSGLIKLLGRRDFQIKLRGIRIELGEIESTLRQFPMVADAIVVCRKGKSELNELVAYVLEASNMVINTDGLKNELQKILPFSMIPNRIVVISGFPLTPNGKIDRQALQDVGKGDHAPSMDYVSPRTSLEEILAEIWCTMLDLQQVGVKDNFFEFGGNSLIAIQVISRLRDILECEISIRTIFEQPTIEQLAQVLDSHVNVPFSDKPQ